MQVIIDAEKSTRTSGSLEVKPLHYFAVYLQQQELQLLDVSIKAKVRYVSVYNAINGIPITPEHARQIRQAVLTMTGIPFDGEFVLTEPESMKDVPTIPIKRIPKQNYS